MKGCNLSKKQIALIIAVAVCLIVGVLAFVMISGSDNGSPSETESRATSVTTVETTEIIETTENITETELTTETEQIVPIVDPKGEHIIYDGQGITVKVSNMVYDENGLTFDCSTANSTGKELNFIIDISSVNGYMIQGYTTGLTFDTDGTVDVILRVDDKALDRQFIKDIRSVEFRLYAYDDDRNYYLMKENSTITFSNDPTSDDEEGRVVYDGTDLKVTYLGLSTDGAGSLSPAFLFESRYDEDIDIYLNSLSIDGRKIKMEQMTMGMTGDGMLLRPGKTSVFVPDAFMFLANNGEFSGFDNTDTVEISFVAKEWIEKKDIFTTDSIVLNFPEDSIILKETDSSNTDIVPEGNGGFEFIEYGGGFFYAKDETGSDGIGRIYYVPVLDDGTIVYEETVIHEYRDNGQYVITPYGTTFFEDTDYYSKEHWKYPTDTAGVEEFDIAKFEKCR